MELRAFIKELIDGFCTSRMRFLGYSGMLTLPLRNQTQLKWLRACEPHPCTFMIQASRLILSDVGALNRLDVSHDM